MRLGRVKCLFQELLLLIRNAFLVLVLGFDVVDIGCPNEDYSQIMCTGAVHDFQNGQLAFVGDPTSSFSVAAFASGLNLVHQGGITLCRQNLRVSHQSTSMHKTKLHRTDSK